jgi:hypothetical protein
MLSGDGQRLAARSKIGVVVWDAAPLAEGIAAKGR